ncbi:mechanosensitive ion channel domain-containing protein [Lacipirellula parvula]|uniref:Potassium efflux system KefA protein / Small-conductance mechanosensitive channel n=1 Tax=Lacipirellula parvula TaxID=2650471 RepID=A0A5K7XDP8_9BACT|nr:mechanosensitive ion channel domain-containing protein [Lacipirellula parvula]BBO31149.1 potassium efflux system KefA protein / Small-conductance mechanosensitive channel [Lacipirellula parvula]
MHSTRQLLHRPTSPACRTTAAILTFIAIGLAIIADNSSARGQAPAPAEATKPIVPATEVEAAAQVPPKVDVQPLADDVDIASRLERIMIATKWFVDPKVDVQEGVVFLDGQANRESSKEWATKLAGSTQDVVAVVNRMTVVERSAWDFSPAWEQLRVMGRTAVQSLPAAIISIFVLVLTFFATILATRMARRFGTKKFRNALLSEVAARAAAIPVIIIGLYLAMRVSGLTQIAATVLGGTGLIGIIIGIAFRDIAENFLASILISMQRPFQAGDLVTITDHHGFVQKVTTRGTIIVTLDGNHVQIPNATIYKSVIRNHSANPNGRLDYIIRIGYDDSMERTQEIVLKVLREHPAVLADPEPLILVEELTATGINIHAYFWINGRDFSGSRVRSATLRQIVAALAEAGITMPDAREVIFPLGVPLIEPEKAEAQRIEREEEEAHEPAPPIVTRSEGGLRNEREVIREQVKQSRELEPGSNLLKETAAAE